MTWEHEHDEIVARYVERHLKEDPEESAFIIFGLFKGVFDFELVLRKVRYWRGVSD